MEFTVTALNGYMPMFLQACWHCSLDRVNFGSVSTIELQQFTAQWV